MINYEEIARDLYALGSYAMLAILVALLAIMRDTTLIIEVIIAIAIAFVLGALFHPDERIVRLIVFLTTLALLGGTIKAYVIAVIVGVAALVMAGRYLERPDVLRSALIGGLVQALALILVSFV